MKGVIQAAGSDRHGSSEVLRHHDEQDRMALQPIADVMAGTNP